MIPIVLVHGFGGWGREEMAGKFWYWGGFSDLQAQLNSGAVDGREVRVMTAAVGPFSSVWDRAVELFYQIKGGTVDYGAAHASEHGHARFGRTFPGLYPEWDCDHPVHLVGHSMGGLTARALVQMLSDNGAPSLGEEGLFGAGDASCAGEGFAYIRPRHYHVDASWVRSVTTIACPHDGTPMVDLLDTWVATLFDSMCYGTGLAGGLQRADACLYDFKLDQWGIEPRRAGEAWREYSSRVMGASVWKDKPRDLCHFDLSLQGAAELNAWVKEAPGVLYLSFSASTTYPDPLFGSVHVPYVATNPMFLMSAAVIGSSTVQPTSLRPGIGREWRVNDGMVSTVSQHGPTKRFSRCEQASNCPDPEHGMATNSGSLPAEDHLGGGDFEMVGGGASRGGGVTARLVGRAGRVGKFEVHDVEIVDHGLPVARKMVSGFLAWRHPNSPLRRSGVYLKKGVWQHVGCFEAFDHLACIGWTHVLDTTVFQGTDAKFFWNAAEWYRDLVALLRRHAEEARQAPPCATEAQSDDDVQGAPQPVGGWGCAQEVHNP